MYVIYMLCGESWLYYSSGTFPAVGKIQLETIQKTDPQHKYKMEVIKL